MPEYDWSGLLADPKAATAAARERLDHDLTELGSATVAYRRALEEYPADPISGTRDVPVTWDGELPADLQELQAAALDEARRGWGWDVRRPVMPPPHVEAAIRLGVRGSSTYAAMTDDTWKRRWAYDGREHAKQQRVQAALDVLHAPEPAPQEPRVRTGWGAL